MIKKIQKFSLDVIIQIRLMGWKIWYFQNLLTLIIPPLIITSSILLIFLLWQSFFITSTFLNLIFYLFFLFDLVAIVVVAISFLLPTKDEKTNEEKTENQENEKESNEKKLSIIIGILGLVWFLISVYWRFPLLTRDPLELGIFPRTVINQGFFFLDYYGSQVFFPFLILFADIILCAFLISQDYYLTNKSRNQDNQESISYYPYSFLPNMGTIYGTVKIIADIPIIFFLMIVHQLTSTNNAEISVEVPQLILLIIVLRLIIVPILGMRANRKFISCYSPGKKEAINKLKKDKWINYIYLTLKTCNPTRIRPSKKTTGIITIIVVTLLLLPFSPLFIMNFQPQPVITGPIINRTASSKEAIDTMEYVEGLNLTDIVYGNDTGFDTINIPYFMDNSTLNKFLTKIDEIRRGSGPYHASLSWNISVDIATFPVLNSTTFLDHWKEDYFLLAWWDNNSQTKIYCDQSINDTPFANFSQEITWIFEGQFSYSEATSDLAAEIINVKQLILLDNNLQLVCLAHYQMIIVS